MSTTNQPPSGPTPERIMQFAWAFGPTRILATALEIGLFTQVAAGQATVERLAAATGASARGVGMLANALVGLGLLSRAGDDVALARFANAPDADAFLVQGRPGYRGDFILFHADHIMRDWAQLTASVKSGRPVIALDDPAQATEFWGRLVGGLFASNYAAARALGAEIARLHGQGALRVLDIAAGSGVWGIGIAHVMEAARITAFDLPSTLEHTGRTAAQHGVKDRCELKAGDLRHDDFGSGYDVAVLGHICHSEGAAHTRELLAKTARALRPGGTLAIAEFLVDDDRRGPSSGLFFALNMLVHTTDGDAFTLAEFRQWLTAAGFRDVRTLAAPAPSPLILATRA